MLVCAEFGHVAKKQIKHIIKVFVKLYVAPHISLAKGQRSACNKLSFFNRFFYCYVKKRLAVSYFYFFAFRFNSKAYGYNVSKIFRYEISAHNLPSLS